MLNIRLYDKDSEKMIYHNESIKQDEQEFYPYVFSIGFSHFKSENFILMYGSGLFDINNREIFEGDLLRINIKGNYTSLLIEYKCIFENGAFWLKNDNFQYYLYIIKTSKEFNNAKVIGNIYDI
jgi:hypothetical protein